MRVIGLDYGDKTVGVALSDETGFIAQPFETVKRERKNKLRKTCSRIEEIMNEYQVEQIVLGLPMNMDDSEGDRCQLTRQFGEMLSDRTGLEVIYQDERLTTFAADEILEKGGIKKTDRKAYIDKIAAAIILQAYLDSVREEKE